MLGIKAGLTLWRQAPYSIIFLPYKDFKKRKEKKYNYFLNTGSIKKDISKIMLDTWVQTDQKYS